MIDKHKPTDRETRWSITKEANFSQTVTQGSQDEKGGAPAQCPSALAMYARYDNSNAAPLLPCGPWKRAR